MGEDTMEWPKRPRAGRVEPSPKPRPAVGRSRSAISRRKLLGIGLGAAAVGLFGRGVAETAIDVKESVGKSVRAFKSLGRFFHQEPGAVTTEEISEVSSTTRKPQTEFSLVFHDLPERESQQAVTIVRRMHGVISTNSEYQNGNLYKVTKKREALIRQEAERLRVNPNLAIGIVFVENGGGEKIINQNSGAAGIAQLMEVTAARYGLKVDETIDERLDPKKAIPAMCSYLADLHLEFLDPGLAVWAYHAGEGNVYSALRAYFKNVDGQDYGDVVTSQDPAIAEKYRRLIAERNLTVHQVLENRQVQSEVLSQLGDETELYVYKVVAASQLFKINEEAFG